MSAGLGTKLCSLAQWAQQRPCSRPGCGDPKHAVWPRAVFCALNNERPAFLGSRSASAWCPMRWDSTTGLACSHLPPTYLAPPPWTDRRGPGWSCRSDRPLVQQPPWSPEQAQDTAGCVHGRRPEVSLHEPDLTEQQMSATSKRREQPPPPGRQSHS